ncbi:MAG: LysM peptidoglycan-binding domain-containing protein [Ferruginibacter sp.]
MKRILMLLLGIPAILTAQQKPLVVEGIGPGLYITHKVAAKENYYSIGRLYNISPKEIAPFNKLVLEAGLSLNQVIQVPLSTSNFLQSGNAAPDEALVPVYYAVKEKEGLFRVSENHNKVPIEFLTSWNKLSSTALPKGTTLIIGYLKVKKELSAFASMAVTKPTDVAVAAPVTPAVTTPPVKAPVKEPVVTAPPVKAPVKEPVVTAPPVKKEPTPPVVKETPPVVKEAPVVTSRKLDGGTFKTEFERQAKNRNLSNESGSAAVFKSTSGWEDGKYYCLHNTAAPGTILKITNAISGKTVYAKVLDIIPDIKQNAGLIIRLSNAAADELGATADAKFDCSINYAK